MGLYNRFVMPFLVDCACGTRPIARQRAKVVPQARGVVLEIGAGGGRNFGLYDRGQVSRLIALEPDPAMVRKAAARAPGGLEVEWIERGAEAADLEPASVDTIVTTFTLCTIPEAARALEALRPALRPGGSLLFCEHGLAPDAGVQAWQRRIEPVWKRLAGGCHLTRDIGGLIESAGWRLSHVESMYLPRTPRIAGWQVWGSAEPA